MRRKIRGNGLETGSMDRQQPADNGKLDESPVEFKVIGDTPVKLMKDQDGNPLRDDNDELAYAKADPIEYFAFLESQRQDETAPGQPIDYQTQINEINEVMAAAEDEFGHTLANAKDVYDRTIEQAQSERDSFIPKLSAQLAELTTLNDKQNKKIADDARLAEAAQKERDGEAARVARAELIEKWRKGVPPVTGEVLQQPAAVSEALQSLAAESSSAPERSAVKSGRFDKLSKRQKILIGSGALVGVVGLASGMAINGGGSSEMTSISNPDGTENEAIVPLSVIEGVFDCFAEDGTGDGVFAGTVTASEDIKWPVKTEQGVVPATVDVDGQQLMPQAVLTKTPVDFGACVPDDQKESAIVIEGNKIDINLGKVTPQLSINSEADDREVGAFKDLAETPYPDSKDIYLTQPNADAAVLNAQKPENIVFVVDAIESQTAKAIVAPDGSHAEQLKAAHGAYESEIKKDIEDGIGAYYKEKDASAPDVDITFTGDLTEKIANMVPEPAANKSVSVDQETLKAEFDLNTK